MLLAAGRSTRLGTLGSVLPKPLIPICGYPAITYGLALCRQAGLDDIVINTHHHGGLIQEAIGDGQRFGVKVRYSVEEELLGTGGGLARARSLFQPGPVLVMNAKVVADVDLRALVDAHKTSPSGTVSTMVLREAPRPDTWSPVGVDATGYVISLRGKSTDRTPVGPIFNRMFTGIHILEPALLDRLRPGISDVIDAAYIPALMDGARIQSFKIDGYFADPSTPERYLEANAELLRDPGQLKVSPGPLVGIDPSAKVDDSARVIMPSRIAAGAVIEAGAVVGPESVVGEGAVVATWAQVEKSVVWAGATAHESCRGTVIHA
jgi:mannose-1-phosphate guanylyltransferase